MCRWYVAINRPSSSSVATQTLVILMYFSLKSPPRHVPFISLPFHAISSCPVCPYYECSTSHPFGLKEIENEKGRNNISLSLSLDISLHCNFNYSIHLLQRSFQSDRNAYFFLINPSFRILYSFIMYIYIYIWSSR